MHISIYLRRYIYVYMYVFISMYAVESQSTTHFTFLNVSDNEYFG